ncbi:glutamate synthase-related protein [Pseudochelatococcus sp. B33]
MNQVDRSCGLYDDTVEKNNCGVGFITRKDGQQTHEVIRLADEALCAVPHRGGMSAEGVGDGAGVSIDVSLAFFRKLTGRADLEPGLFGIGNFFWPRGGEAQRRAVDLVSAVLRDEGLGIVLVRDVPVNDDALRPAAVRFQLPIRQWVFMAPPEMSQAAFDLTIYRALQAIEAQAFTDSGLGELYPLSLSARTQVLKGRLNSNEVIPYFRDLADPDHGVRSLFFHTRFSTNTDPHPSMAQPFRLMAHNGELNTDKKNRLSEAAVVRARNGRIVRPRGQSDSCRFDQTLHGRLMDDALDLVTAVVSMMPPAWENNGDLDPDVRAMLEYFSLYEEKNDGPAALIFGNGDIIGARLDRLGLRPLRTVETADYLCVMSEAGQIGFPPETVIHRGRIEAGGMLYFDHREGRAFGTDEALRRIAARRDYKALVAAARVNIEDLPAIPAERQGSPLRYNGDFKRCQRYVAYAHNQESFRFLMDPMLETGAEKVSAMGYGNAINALSDQEGGVAKYFSQRFAQVTNPPLDSLREADGMTMRVALGAKAGVGGAASRQIVIRSPLLSHLEMLQLREQKLTPFRKFELLYGPVFGDAAANARALEEAIDVLCRDVADFAHEQGGIAVLSDRHVSRERAVLPLTIAISAVNQRLIDEGLRLRISVIAESGQIASAHHVATALGFGASAVYPLGVQLRAEEKFGEEGADKAFGKFVKAAEKSLMKTMGKVGLCTVESYIGGEFFEPNFLDTNDPVLRRYFPNMKTPVGGVGFETIAQAVADWHERASLVHKESDIPLLGLFKERNDGAGHSFGTVAVRGFVDMTEERISRPGAAGEDADILRLLPLNRMEDAFGVDETAYRETSFEQLSPEAIDNFRITPGYRAFSRMMAQERARRPAALRDVLAFPADVTCLNHAEDFRREMGRFSRRGNNGFQVRGLACRRTAEDEFRLRLTAVPDAVAGALSAAANDVGRLTAMGQSLLLRFGEDITGHWLEEGELVLRATGEARGYLALLRRAPDSIPLEDVQRASEITRQFASGAMSHGALNAPAHEAVAHGTNMVGGLSNSGEGGEHISRYGTIRASRIKQFASGRFGVWAGYLADPMLEELEIKIGQGAKPGEGGQLPAKKVTVEIAAARGGTPGVELVSPPPHHDTYSIEDLAQLIHDCKAARVRVIVKLVSSEGVGTIAVGVAKAGADVINVAGNTGGTGAAAVTSLKYTGRVAEIGVAEVHQALCANGLRQKVTLRCSGAHQTASDVVKSALLGGDSFEFGTAALMMLKCVMAKNCNIKCPAGLTTNSELFDGDPRALAQYLVNVAHETREILATLGLRSLREARGRSDLLHLLDHPASVGQLDLRAMLTVADATPVSDPVYMEADYSRDDDWFRQVHAALVDGRELTVEIGGGHLGNRNKSIGGQLAVDIERLLNHTLTEANARALPSVIIDDRGRRFLDGRSVTIETTGSAGQSYGAFCNDGMVMRHTGTCNDGVGKGACGGVIAVRSPGGGSRDAGGNVLIGNFALFGATGGRTFIEGQAGDRFAVRNSGATAVVEGVGDFCCEYMTNGAVLNLGAFGAGFGNGMSGGFVYQYDPYGDLPKKVSADSLLLFPIAGDDEASVIHADAVHRLLEWHLAETGSHRAAWLLANWEAEKRNFVYGLPVSLLQYQDCDAILAAKSRKDLLEEFSEALAGHQLRKFKLAFRDRRPVLGGVAPEYGHTDTSDMYALLNNYTVLNAARQLAAARLKQEGKAAPGDAEIGEAMRKLVLTEDFALMQKLQRHAREALQDYEDMALSALVASKRLGDYKEALARRNVISMDSPGTYGWILYQNARNIERLGRLPDFEELFARAALPEIVASANQHG